MLKNLPRQRPSHICDGGHPKSLDLTGHAAVEARIRSARQLANSYLQHHAGAVVDRGCEGTPVSYYHTVTAYSDHLERMFLKNSPVSRKEPGVSDGPPAPAY